MAPESERKSTAGRSNNANLLRFILASMVIYYHMGPLLGQPTVTIMGQGLGYVAVNGFFILSGFFIAGSWARSSGFAAYLIRRIARIFPGLIVVVLLTVFVLGPLMTTLSPGEYFSHPGTWRYLSIALLAPVDNVLPGVFESVPFPRGVNGSLWTLRYEFLMYLILPLLYLPVGKAKAKAKAKPISIGAAAVFSVLHVLTAGDILAMSYHLAVGFRLAAYFFIGVAAFELNLPKRIGAQHAALAALVMVIFAQESGWLCTAVMLVAVTLFSLGFSFPANPVFARCFAENDYSYGIYVYAFPLQQVCVQLGAGSPESSALLFSLVSLAVTFLFAFASWHLVEKPSIRLGKRLSARFQAARDAKAA